MEAVKTLIREVSKAVRLRSAMLFGSVVRGDADKLSDVDLLLICDEVFKARKLVYDLNPPLDVVIYSPKEMALMAKLGLPFIHHLANEGRVLLDDGTFKSVLDNLKEVDERTLEVLLSEARENVQKCSLLLEFKAAYVTNIFGVLMSLIEADLCFHGYKIFKKDEAIQKFFELHPKLLPLKETMLSMLSFYRSYARSKEAREIDVGNLPRKVEQILEAIERELPRES